MKTKTIAKAIKSKIEDWADSVTDPEVAAAIRTQTLVSGGCIASMLLKEPVNDYDVYFATPEAALKVAHYYAHLMIEEGHYNVAPRIKFFVPNGETEIYKLHRTDDGDFPILCMGNTLESGNYPKDFISFEVYIKSQGFAAAGTEEHTYRYFEGEAPERADDFINSDDEQVDETGCKYRPVFMSSNAITLSNKIQLVLRFTGTPAEIHKNFDFVHCTNYWAPKDGLVLNIDAVASILAKDLQYVGSLFPLASIFRTRKFIQRGWTCHVGNYLKMAIQLNDLDLKNLGTLRDQLTGMDAAYLQQVIQAVEKGQAANGAEITTTYLMTLVERIMGE